ncbi:unnamed protein product, partial [Brassica rapa subsp. trilocularis]
MCKPLTVVFYLVALLFIVSGAAEEGNDCGCSAAAVNSATDLKYKIVAIFSTFIVGVFGVCLPIFGLDLDGIFYASVRRFGAYVMGFSTVIYILPDAIDSLTSSCIGDFPMTGVVVAMAAAILTMIESISFASAFMNRAQDGDDHKIGHKLVTQFLELGNVVHSLIIGIALGASPNLSTIKFLIPAITFHQLLQGLRRGGCISKAKFELKKTLIMVILFSLTTPVGIGIGIGVAEIYYKSGPITLIVSGCLNAAAAGILLFVTAGNIGSNLKPHSTCHMHVTSFRFCPLLVDA